MGTNIFNAPIKFNIEGIYRSSLNKQCKVNNSAVNGKITT